MLSSPFNDSDSTIRDEKACSSPLFAPTYERTRSFQLSDNQEEIIKSYVETYAEHYLNNFISAAPTALQPLRLFIIQQSLTLSPNIFAPFLNKFYPTVAETDETYEQNLQLRNYLLSFNQMIMGKFDVNHQLFSLIFANKLTSALPDSPTKRNLVREIFRHEISQKFNFSNESADKFIEGAKILINELMLESTGIKPRRLFFK